MRSLTLYNRVNNFKNMFLPKKECETKAQRDKDV